MTPGHPSDFTDTRLEAASDWCMQLADGHLSPEDEAAFAAWLEADEANREAFDRITHLWQHMGMVATLPELIDRRQAALTEFQRANQRRWIDRFKGRWGLITGLAAALLLAVLTFSLSLWPLPDHYRTDQGERRVYVLSDGSRLTLDAASHVKARLTAERRELWLARGRARFDVAKDAARPFTVMAGDKVVVATGTSFSVEKVQAQVQVVLYEGQVVVHDQTEPVEATTAAAHGTPEKEPDASVLQPGQQLVSSLIDEPTTIAAVDLALARSWENGQLTFVDEPLALAVERMNRYANVKLITRDLRTGGLHVNGVFNAGDIEAFLVGISETLPVRVERHEDRILIRHKV